MYSVLFSGRAKDLVNSNLLNCVAGHLHFLVKCRLLDVL